MIKPKVWCNKRANPFDARIWYCASILTLSGFGETLATAYESWIKLNPGAGKQSRELSV